MIIKFVMKFLPTCLPSGLTVAAPDAFGRIPGVHPTLYEVFPSVCLAVKWLSVIIRLSGPNNMCVCVFNEFYSPSSWNINCSIFNASKAFRKLHVCVKKIISDHFQNFESLENGETYARRSAKKEDVELDTLSKWIKSIGDVLKRRIRRLEHSINTRHESIFSDLDVVTELPSPWELCHSSCRQSI